METTKPLTDSATSDSRWNSLYNVGGAAALLMALFIPIQIMVFIAWPPPSTVTGWFTLFQNNRLIGLLDMDLLLITDQVLIGLLLLALYRVLKQTNPSLMAIALVLGLLGIAAYFASTSAFEMLGLSNQYAAATTDAQKSILLAAGQVMLSNWMGTAFDVGYVIEGIAFLITGIVMLRSMVFTKTIAVTGIVMGVLSLLPPTAGTPGLIFSLTSLIPLEIWAVMVGIRLLRLGK